MVSGLIFDIKEFAILDGPGVRTTVFLKGCPLRCQWCHNPEGLTSEPQTIHGLAGDRVAGEWYSADSLADLLNRQAAALNAGEGGVTFSGGEPLLQAAFVGEVMDRLDGLHIVLDTCGYGDSEDFRRLAGQSDLVLFDLKLMDGELHRRYTGTGNGPILDNLTRLDTIDVPTIIRVPLVPGVTDTEDNLRTVARRASCLRALVRVELLPYNRAAGGKYASCGMRFEPSYDETAESAARLDLFEAEGVPAVVV